MNASSISCLALKVTTAKLQKLSEIKLFVETPKWMYLIWMTCGFKCTHKLVLLAHSPKLDASFPGGWSQFPPENFLKILKVFSILYLPFWMVFYLSHPNLHGELTFGVAGFVGGTTVHRWAQVRESGDIGLEPRHPPNARGRFNLIGSCWFGSGWSELKA